jgi:adenylosuccinate synthase
MSGKVSVVVGGQYGSEAKGAVAAYLAAVWAGPTVGVRVAGPNAGHTVYGDPPPELAGSYDPGAYAWRLRQVPVAAVADPEAVLVIAAGSEIDPDVLAAEVKALDSAGYKVSDRLYIDASATVIEAQHVHREQISSLTKRLGSTAKGIGAARADRVWRFAKTWGQIGPSTSEWTNKLGLEDTAGIISVSLLQGQHVIIEGTQGYGLGLHTDNYPFVTSSDCRAIDFLAMAGISPWDPAVGSLDVWVVLRTRPIRVAGNSGEIKGETSWEALGLPEEHTTVTQKVRRVGEWDADLAKRAIVANGRHVKVALTMLDQVFPEVTGSTEKMGWPAEVWNYIAEREEEIGAPIHLVGTSPTTMVRWR